MTNRAYSQLDNPIHLSLLERWRNVFSSPNDRTAFLWLSKARISMPSMNVNIWAISQSQSGPLLFLTLIVVLDWGLRETSFPFKPQAQLWENVQISFSFIWDKRTTAKYLIFTTVTPKLLNQLSVDTEKLFLSSSLLERL